MFQNETESLDRWTDAIESEEQTLGPSAAVITRTLDAIGRQNHQPRWRRIGAIAAGIGVAIGGAGLVWLLSLPAQSAVTWGDVIATVSDAHTMTCRTEIRMIPSGDASHARSDIGKLMIKSPGLRREEQAGWIIITNWLARKRINLNTDKKIATVSDLSGDMPRDTKPIQTFDELKNLKDAQPLGQREIDGVTEIGFHFHHDSQLPGMIVHYVNDIWADAKSHRIIQSVVDAETTSTPDRDHPWNLGEWRQQKIHLVMDDMKWNVPLDDSLFSVVPPAGYKVVPGGKIKTEIIK